MAEETPQLFNLTPETLLTAVTNGIPVTVRLGDMAEYLGSTAPAPAPAPAPQPAPTVRLICEMPSFWPRHRMPVVEGSW